MRRRPRSATVVELPLLVAVYSPLASSASGVVDLAALLLGLGTILIAMRMPPRGVRADFYDFVAKMVAVWVQAPALLAGVITELGDNGVTQAIAAVALSLGVCARVDACVRLIPSEHRQAVGVIFRCGMPPAMTKAVLATFQEHACDLAAAVDALRPDEVTAVFAAVAAQE